MPRIFDNIQHQLLPALATTLHNAHAADFCVGFFNLRGWKLLADAIDRFEGGERRCCRVLIGMNERPDEQLRAALRLTAENDGLDLQRARQLERQVAEEFRSQLMAGNPTNADELALQRLARQLRAGQAVVKLHLRYPLHAKLYLMYRDDYNNPITGYLGSSNLTMAGLRQQGELNIDVLDHSATQELQRWFEDRWGDRWSLDISTALAEIIEESWAGERLLSPYLIYLKMAYHLSQEARAGLSEFSLPSDFRGKLFPFQEAAIKIAARHLNQRGGVLLGDVVGLGKTMMATALARIFKDDLGWRPLIICPKNLVAMWQEYNLTWDLGAEVLPISMAQKRLPQLSRRYRLLIIDESHGLRNREGKRYRAIKDYIDELDCRVVLLSATPYNKSYLDLSAQLRLFVPEDADLGVRPEAYLREIGEQEFAQQQVPPRSLRAFERSPFADDWRELMRLYMVRRTRSFIKQHYAAFDAERGRAFLELRDGQRFYFPERVPRTVLLTPAADDPYGQLYDHAVVEAIAGLALPRYGLANYLTRAARQAASAAELPVLEHLSRAGKRLMGFSRTNLFKRLESGGWVFLQSLDRHILRNYVVIHALANGQPIPIGPQEAQLLELDTDLDGELLSQTTLDEELDLTALDHAERNTAQGSYAQRAAQLYALYAGKLRKRFKWLRPELFTASLQADLLHDAQVLTAIVERHGRWDADSDIKLRQLLELLRSLGGQKVLIFSQFADTVDYLVAELQRAQIPAVEGATGQSANPTELARRFSPRSNGVTDTALLRDQIQVLVATDVLSEGQNLQDCAHIINYDLPWAIIRLIQRAGRVDRIGQEAPTITCYTFLPAEGVERILRLRARVRQRLLENGEVVGTDERFFDEGEQQLLHHLYNEAAGSLDDPDDAEVDLASYAYQIWRNATAANPSLKRRVEALPNVVFSAKALEPAAPGQAGVLVYLRTTRGTDALAWLDAQGRSITQSQLAILRAAECTLDTPALRRSERHHELVQAACELVSHDAVLAGSLGSPRSARYRLYEQLKAYLELLQASAPLLVGEELRKTVNEVYLYPLRQSATDAINRQLRSGMNAEQLAELAIALRSDGRLCIVDAPEAADGEPQIVCSLGLTPHP